MELVRFKDIPGQTQVKDRLRQMRDQERIPHALLLSGPPGVGKTMLARAFMAYAHCEHPHDGESCGTCRNCRLHADISHPDVHFSYPIPKNKAKGILIAEDLIGPWQQMLRESPAMSPERWLDLSDAGNSQPAIHVEEAKEILRMTSFPPFVSKLKFFMIWLPEKLNAEAANRLLKIIEEPSEGTCFLLVSNNELEVLPTIFSRTQRLHTGLIDTADIAGYLQHRWHIDPLAASRLAPVAAGSLAKADQLGSHSGETDEFRRVFQALMRDAYSRKIENLRKAADAIAAFGREKILRFLNYFQSMLRENFIYNIRVPALNHLTPEDEAFSRNFSPFINAGNIEEMMSQTDRARLEIARNGNAKIVLFDFFLLIVGLIRKKAK